MTLKTYNVYVEDFNGNFYDEYTIEAETIDKAYDHAYEKLNWAAMEVHIEEVEDEDYDPSFGKEEPSTMLQNAYFEGKNPLESFPSLKWGSK